MPFRDFRNLIYNDKSVPKTIIFSLIFLPSAHLSSVYFALELY